jgi:predicted small lipoprotein YifL
MNIRILYLCIVLVTAAGCGKKGALIPPEALVPAPVSALQLTQRGETFRVSWEAPTREVSGRPLGKDIRFRLFRREVLPPGQDCSTCPEVWKLLRELDPAVPPGMEQANGHFVYSDRELVPDVTYQYRIQALDASGGISRPATLAPRQRLTPPFPPVLQAAPGGTGVRLEFVAPTNSSRETNVGYLLYRQDGAQPVRQLTPTPLAVVTLSDYDVRPGHTYRYTARTVATINGQSVESGNSNEALITVTLPE